MNLRAFVSCSFDDEVEERVVKPLMDLLEECGIKAMMLKAGGSQVSVLERIETGIQECDLFVAIITQNGPAQTSGSHGHQGGTSVWIHHEIGFALGCQKPIVVFLERGVDRTNLGFLPFLITWAEFERSTLCAGPQLGPFREMVQTAAEQCQKKRRQIIGEFDVLVPRPRGGPTRLPVRQLATGHPLELQWPTVILGMDYLYEQVSQFRPAIQPDMIVGVNGVGGMMAGYFHGRFKTRATPLVSIRTGPPDAKGHREFYGPLPPEEMKNALVVDGTYKSGSSAVRIVDQLREKYGKKLIVYFAVFSAWGIDVEKLPKDRDIEIGDLFAQEVNVHMGKKPPRILPDFVALVTRETLKFPHDIR